MIKIKEKISLFEHDVIVICCDGQVYRGMWYDCIDAEDRDEDEQQEDSIIIETPYSLHEIYESEIESIQLDE